MDYRELLDQHDRSRGQLHRPAPCPQHFYLAQEYHAGDAVEGVSLARRAGAGSELKLVRQSEAARQSAEPVDTQKYPATPTDEAPKRLYSAAYNLMRRFTLAVKMVVKQRKTAESPHTREECEGFLMP